MRNTDQPFRMQQELTDAGAPVSAQLEPFLAGTFIRPQGINADVVAVAILKTTFIHI